MKRFGFSSIAAAVVLVVAAGSLLARQSAGSAPQAQPAPAPQKQQVQPAAKPADANQPAKPKAKRVWTNEDVIALRKGFDEYGGQKSAEDPAKTPEKSPAGSAAGSEAAQAEPETTLGGLPATIEDAQARVAQKQEEISNLMETLLRVRTAYSESVDDDQRAALVKKRQELTGDLESAQVELKVLEARLQALKAKLQPPAKPAQPASAPPTKSRSE